jgi:hypothetical protein
MGCVVKMRLCISTDRTTSVELKVRFLKQMHTKKEEEHSHDKKDKEVRVSMFDNLCFILQRFCAISCQNKIWFLYPTRMSRAHHKHSICDTLTDLPMPSTSLRIRCVKHR